MSCSTPALVHEKRLGTTGLEECHHTHPPQGQGKEDGSNSKDGLCKILAEVGRPLTLPAIVNSFHDGMEGPIMYYINLRRLQLSHPQWCKDGLRPCLHILWDPLCCPARARLWVCIGRKALRHFRTHGQDKGVDEVPSRLPVC
ncbi:hypothetical protein ACROYT_G009703 [Oculina patagonica]